MPLVFIFIASGLLVYAYLLYPLLIAALAKIYSRPSRIDEHYQPMVSVILAAYNEERNISVCLDSLLAQKYPAGQMEILVGSDGSLDRTNEILRQYSAVHSSVKIFLFEDRRGKMQVLNDLIAKANGEILFFTDADMTLSPDAIAKHARHYGSESTGGVAGIYTIVSTADSSTFGSESDYHKYEMWLRKNEALIHSTVGLSGGNYSIRKELWQKMPSDFVHDDLFSVFSLLESGKRLLYEPGAISSENFTRSAKEEFSRKARFASRGFATIHYFPKLLSPQAGFASVMIWSHKILRWISPFLFLIIFCATALGIGGDHSSFFRSLFLAEISFVGIALLGWIFDSFGISIPLIRHIFWFTAMNLAFLIGTLRFLFKRDEKHWTAKKMTSVDKKGAVLV